MMEFEQALLKILSNDSVQRKEAEKFIEQIETRPDFYKILLSGLSLNTQSACLAGIIFRQKFVELPRFKDLHAEAKSEVKSCVLATVTPEKSLAYLKIVASVMVPLFKLESNYEEAFNLLVFAKDCLVPDFLLCLIEILAFTWQDFVSGSSRQLCEFLWEITEKSSNSQLNACNLLIHISPQHQLESEAFSLKVLSLMQNHKSPDLSVLIQSILAKMKEGSKIMQSHLESFINLLVFTSSSPDSGHYNKVASTQVLISLHKSNLPVKTLQDLLVFAFKLLSDVQHYSDLNAWASDVHDNDAIYDDNVTLAKDLLLSLLCTNKCNSIYMQLAQAHLDSGHWVHQQAGVLALGYFCEELEVCDERLVRVFDFVGNSNPRVRWAACEAVAAIVNNWAEALRSEMEIWRELAENLLSGLDNLVLASVRASICLIDALDRNPVLCQGDMEGFVRVLLGLFASENLNNSVMLELFELVAYICEYRPEDFSPYQQQFLTGFENIIKSNLPYATRGKAIKTFGIMCSSSLVLAKYFCDLLFPYLGTNASIDIGILECGPIFLMSLKEDFYPFCDYLMTQTLKNASISIRNTQESNNFVAQFQMDMNPDFNWEVNTDNINRKVVACKTLWNFAKLGEIFKPYALETLRVANELKDYKKSKKIMKYAKGTIKSIHNLQTLIVN